MPFAICHRRTQTTHKLNNEKGHFHVNSSKFSHSKIIFSKCYLFVCHSFKSLRFHSPQHYRNTAVCGLNNNFARVCSQYRKCHVSGLLLLLLFVVQIALKKRRKKKHSIWGKKVNALPSIADWSVHLTSVIVASFLSFAKITKSIRVKNTNEERWTSSVWKAIESNIKS